MKNSTLAFFFTLLTLVSINSVSAQCTWDTILYHGYENSTPDPNIIANTTYGTSPATWAAHTGTKSLYMNFQNTIPAGTLFYDQTIPVCIGAQYQFSTWLTTTFSGLACNITVQITDSTGNNNLLTFNNTATSFNVWTHLTNTFIPTSTTIHFKMITNVAGSGGGNDLSMDDLLFTVCQPSTILDTMTFCSSHPVFNLFDSIHPALATGGIWSGPGTVTGASLGTYNPATTVGGSYHYSIIGIGGCPNGAATILVNNNNANANLGVDTTLSLCTAISYTLTSPSPSASNLWSDNTTGTSITVNTSGTYWLQVTQGACVSRDSVVVNFSPCNICPTITMTPDTTVCPNVAFNLYSSISGGNIISRAWSPKYGLSDSTIANPSATVGVDTSYYLTIRTRSNNSLVYNGDFSLGNTGFSSGYIYTNTPPPGLPCNTWGILGCDGYYTINTSPRNTHSNFAIYGDHTTGTGNMLIANGSQNSNQDVWCETITVLPNTDYQFAAWVSTAVSGAANSLPHLRFKINGTAVSPAITPSGTAGVWTQFFAIWNSGANTSINICISDSNNAVGGNDFAIDDITFNAVCTVTDSVRITTFKKPVFTLPASVAYCDSIHQILSATMTSGTGTFSYLWTPNNLITQTDTALLAGTYTLAMHNQCPNSTTSISTTLSLNHSPSANLGADTLVCNQPTLQLLPHATGTSPYTYTWSDLSLGDSLIVNTAAAYWVTVSNLCGSYADTINVDFRNTPTANVIQPNDTTICSTSSVVLSIPVLPLYDTLTWQNGTTHTNTYTATTGGTYTVTVKNACGSVLDSTHVYIMASPPASSIGPDTLICNGSSVILKPSPDPSGSGISFTWQDGTTHTNTFSASQFGLYILQVSNACISVFDSVRVDTLSAPFAFNIGTDQGLCTTNTIELRANPTPLPTTTLTWQDGVTHVDSFHVTTSGTYRLTESNKCGNRQASVNITPLFPPTVAFTTIPTLCDKDSVALVPILGGGVGTLAWSTGATTDSIYAKASGTYTLKDSNNCGVGMGNIAIKMVTSPTHPFNDIVIDSCTGSMVLLNAKNSGMTFLWSTGATTQIITADSATKYHVIISDAGDCPIYDSVTVLFHDCANCRMVSPTAFTPNGDGKNEKFHCLFECHIEYFVLKIYNRWGEKIYESYDATDGWNGTYQQTPQPIGIYTYILQYRDSSMKEVKAVSGNITLLR